MARQSISLTRPDDERLKQQVANEQYATKSELVNDLIRKAREQQTEVDWIRAKLKRSKENLKAKGFVNKPSDEILASFKEKARLNGDL